MGKTGEKIKRSFQYALLAVATGVLVGILDTIFGRGLLIISDIRNLHYRYLISFLPVAGLAIVWLYQHFNKESLKGMTLVFEAGQQKREEIPLALIPLVMVTTWITHLFGGSAGREGVAVQIGATLSHALGRRCHLPENGRIMLVTGMAAGFGGLFQTPLAAVFFAMEVIVAGYLDYEALLPALIASYMASFTSHALGLEKICGNAYRTGSFREKECFWNPDRGVVFGLTGRLFSFSLQKMKKILGEKIKSPFWRIGFGAVPLAVFLLLLHSGRYSGLGTNLIRESFHGGTVYAYDWILKLLLTIVTLAIGFQGGEVTPLFSIGATLGVVLSGILGLPAMTCAALGYAAVFGSATNTLLAPIMIGLEVFGPAEMLPFVIVCVIAYLMNGDRSIYAAQGRIGKNSILRKILRNCQSAFKKNSLGYFCIKN